MDLSEAKKKTCPRKKRKRIGRGEGSGYGKTSGRGMDGARSRRGWSQRNMTGGNIPLWRRLPKIGFTNAPFRKSFNVVNVDHLAALSEHQDITPELMKEKGLIKGKPNNGVKVLGRGDIDRPVTVTAHNFSEKAREKIEAAGGKCKVIAGPKKPVKNKMKQKSLIQEISVSEDAE